MINWSEISEISTYSMIYSTMIPLNDIFINFNNGCNLNPSVPFYNLYKHNLETDLNTFLNKNIDYYVPKTKKRKTDYYIDRTILMEFSRIQLFSLSPFVNIWCYSSNKITSDLGENNFLKFRDNQNITINIGKSPQNLSWNYVYCSTGLPHAGMLNSCTIPFPLWRYQ